MRYLDVKTEIYSTTKYLCVEKNDIQFETICLGLGGILSY